MSLIIKTTKRAAKVGKKQQKQQEKGFYFPAEVWDYIKSIAGYGVRKSCHNECTPNPILSDWQRQIFFDLQKKHTVGRVFSVPTYCLIDKSTSNRVDVKLEKKIEWRCEHCITNAAAGCNDIIMFRRTERLKLKKRNTKLTPAKLMEDCLQYEKSHTELWQTRRDNCIRIAEEKVAENLIYEANKKQAEKNKEDLITVLALKLTNGEIPYKTYVEIMKKVVPMEAIALSQLFDRIKLERWIDEYRR